MTPFEDWSSCSSGCVGGVGGSKGGQIPTHLGHPTAPSGGGGGGFEGHFGVSHGEHPAQQSLSGSSGPPGSLHEPPVPPHPNHPNAASASHQQHVVNYHINQGEMVSLELGDGQLRVISGPAQIRMVSTNSGPPQAIPMQPPPGHIVQQILDQNGTLQHVILSLDPAVNPPPSGAPPPAPTAPANAAPYVPMHPYGIPAGGHCISNGSSAHPPFGSPPPTYVAAPRGGASGPPYPPPVISPTPPWNTAPHGDRRTRGPTHERLIRKSRSRQMNEAATPGGSSSSNGAAVSSPPPSPSKGAIPGRTGDGKPSSFYGKTPESRTMDDSEESGVGHEEEEDKETQQLLLELLSNIQAPKESNVTARGALLSWEPPEIDSSDPKFEGLEPIQASEFTYEVLLSDKGKEGRYRSVFKDESLNCRLPDLRPNTEYHVRIHAHLDNLKGGASDTVSFRTLPSEPDTPFPPKVASKSKTSVNLRWNAPSDNGSSIQHYILESDQSGGSYIPVFQGRAKSYNVTKLSPASPYRFRLLAVNEFGASRPSEAILVITQGAPPPKPLPPGLSEASKSSLHLLWSKRLSDVEFILQRNDPGSGHGYISIYSGPEGAYLSSGLNRNTPYKFRLRAVNNEGESLWSDEVTYSTLPDVPAPPGKLAPKGKLHATSFKVRWDPPGDDGGSKVTQYNLELDNGEGWRTVYQGPGCESTCDGLSPGQSYSVRVSCQSLGGVSVYSDPLAIVTEPVKPGAPPPPRLHGKPKADHLYLKWSWPEFDGGDRISEFEIELTSPDNKTLTAYKGRDNECAVASLLPGRPYLFQVRAHNRAGAGPWSDTLEVVSGAGPPGQPQEPRFAIKSPTSISFSWETPINNGALITDYFLELANLSLEEQEQDESEDEEEAFSSEEIEESSCSEDSDDNEVDSSDEEEEERGYESDESQESTSSEASPKKRSPSLAASPKEPQFVVVYNGPNTYYEARSLCPASSYLFRLSASNSAGRSPTSPTGTRITTPPGPPAQITSLRLRERGPTWLNLAWKTPKVHGSPISSYKVDLGSSTVSCTEPHVLLSGLSPDTHYNIRVQAVNAMGSGAFSQSAPFSTRPLPPAPPRLEVISAIHNSIKLKWGDSKAVLDLSHYTLEMENSRKQFQPIYSGSLVSYKVNKLSENTVYRFRISASNEAGHGPYSSIIEATTLYAHPPPLKSAPRVSSITSDGCLVEWTPLKLSTAGLLTYKVSLTKVKEQDSKIIYTGTDSSFRVSGLESRTEYSVKVLPVRVPAPGLSELMGPSSSPGIFTTLCGVAPDLMCSSNKATSGSVKPEKKSFSDQQWAFLILVGFSVFAMLIAVVMHQIIGWNKDEEDDDVGGE